MFFSFSFFCGFIASWLQPKSMAKREIEMLLVDQKILNHIFVIRRKKVMLDENLAALYGVETRRLNEQVKRNLK